ncbi:MAG: MFS transporter [Pseudomonadota bacterium]
MSQADDGAREVGPLPHRSGQSQQPANGVGQQAVSLAKAYPVWAIILAAACIAGIGMGLRQAMGLYLLPLSRELQTGRELFAFSVALSNIVWGVAAPFMGAFSDRYGVGKVVIFGAATSIAGCCCLYLAQSAEMVMLAGVLLGFGVAGTGVNAVVGAVARAAQPTDRTAAIAAVGMGSGIGILLFLPYTHVLISAIDWRTSLLVLAVTIAFVLPLARLVNSAPTDAPGNQQIEPQSMAEALREASAHRGFWLLNLGFFVCGFHVVFYGTHLPAYVSDAGLPPTIAVWSLIAVGLGNLIGTYLAGEWGRVLPKRYGLVLIYAGRAIIFLGFIYLPITATSVIGLSALLGIFWLSTIPLTSGLVATFFGPRWMTMLYGLVFLSHQLGSFAGVWMAGAVYDALGSYNLMWWISAGLGVMAALVHLPIDERPVARLKNA